MASHEFNFEGGDKLRRIGASWFVSYKYHSKDATHINWKKVSTWKSRISNFKSTIELHQLWLREVLKMDDKRLNTNTIELTGCQVKKMAESLLGNQ